MITIGWSTIFGLAALGFLALIVRYLLIPYLKIRARREASLRHMPQAQEIWLQEGALLYIDFVSTNGVDWFAVDEETRAVTKCHDSWEEWKMRIKVNDCYYSGQQQPLGDA
jgi:hypothetical protein